MGLYRWCRGLGSSIALQTYFHSQYRMMSDTHSPSLTSRLYLRHARCGKLEYNNVNTSDVIVYYWSPEPDFFVPREKCGGSTHLFCWYTLDIFKAQVMCHWGLYLSQFEVESDKLVDMREPYCLCYVDRKRSLRSFTFEESMLDSYLLEQDYYF